MFQSQLEPCWTSAGLCPAAVFHQDINGRMFTYAVFVLKVWANILIFLKKIVFIYLQPVGLERTESMFLKK